MAARGGALHGLALNSLFSRILHGLVRLEICDRDGRINENVKTGISVKWLSLRIAMRWLDEELRKKTALDLG
jgi:hypothetical protein